MPQHKLIKADQMRKLVSNGQNPDQDHAPVVKFFTPAANATWLISEIDGDQMFGLCDLGHGTLELGYISLAEMQSIRVRGLPVERDAWWDSKHPMSVYADAAREAGHIVDEPKVEG